MNHPSLAHRLFPFPFENAPPPPDLSKPIETTGDESFKITRGFENHLSAWSLDSFSKIWSFREGVIIKKIPVRWVARLDMIYKGVSYRLYLKRHYPNRKNGLKSRLLKQSERPLSPGLSEYCAIRDFRNHGLATVLPLAAGQAAIPGRGTASFLLTLDVFPFISLETLLYRWPGFFRGHHGRIRKQVLIDKMGEYARKMHQAGFNHKDFNATHILLHYSRPMAVPQVALFDLQRVDRHRWMRYRWPVKSLAGLNYTLLDDLFCQKERKRLWTAYLGKKHLNFIDALRWLWICKKTKRIARHQENRHRRMRVNKHG